MKALDNYLETLTTFKAVFLIIILGFIVFGNSLFNGFIGDDFDQIVNNPLTRSLANIALFFKGSTFYAGGELGGIYYKPLLSTLYTFLYTISGGQAFIFHLVQVLLHIANAVLVLFFFKFFFSKITSLLLALVFLIHPINAETVNYIANLQDVLFFFFGMLSLFIIHNNQTQKNIVLAYFLLILSMLSKETGILFILITLLFVALHQKSTLYKHLAYSSVVVVLYTCLRFLVAGIYFGHELSAPIAKLSLADRISNIPAIILYYLKTFLFPKHLVFAQNWFFITKDFFNFYLPLLMVSLLFILLLLLHFYLFKYNRKKTLTLLFFSIWFLLGISLHIQIFPLDMTVADRWFYFPMIGLLGIIAISFSCIKMSKRKTYFLTFPLLGILLVTFSVKTITRNTDWKNNVTLYAHDISQQPDNFILENSLGNEYIMQGDYKKALPHIKKSIQIYPNWTLNWNNLGVIYANLGEIDKAKRALKTAINHGNLPLAYENLVSLLMTEIDQNQTKIFLESSLKKLPNDDKLWTRLAIVDARLGKHGEAIFAAQKAYAINPNQQTTYILYQIMNNLPIELR